MSPLVPYTEKGANFYTEEAEEKKDDPAPAPDPRRYWNLTELEQIDAQLDAMRSYLKSVKGPVEIGRFQNGMKKFLLKTYPDAYLGHDELASITLHGLNQGPIELTRWRKIKLQQTK
jgi:hypothetical protein